MREAVVLIHGIWMGAGELFLLARRLRDAGYTVHLFRYPSLLASPAQNAARLDAWLADIDADVVHLVGHSLGGLVLCHLFNDFPVQRPGRVLMLGTPLRGSVVARRLARWWPTRLLLGRAVEHALLGDGPGWPPGRPLGMVAGVRGWFGVGLLTGGLPRPHDGTVSLVETDTAAVTEHLQVPYNHFGMLFARPVANAVIRFLRSGRLAP